MDETTKRILKLMKEKNITPYRLCKECGIPSSSYWQIINRDGKFKWRLEYLKNVAKYFKVSLDYLAFGVEGIINKTAIYTTVEGGEDILRDKVIKVKNKEIRIRDEKIEKLEKRNEKLHETVKNVGSILNNKLREDAEDLKEFIKEKEKDRVNIERFKKELERKKDKKNS